MNKRRSGDLKPGRKERYAVLPTEMKNRLLEFELGLHGVRDNTKEDYFARMMWFSGFMVVRGTRSFEDVDGKDIDLFLSGYKNPGTKNVFTAVFRRFYRDKPEVVAHLKVYEVELEQITPSEILTPDEVVPLAVEAGKKREIYKYLILALFESCARISELLNLKLS